jgi:hypothetical protein
MRNGAFSMLCAHISVTGLAMGNALLEMRNAFSQMRILHITSHGMLECFVTMLHQSIGMTLFAMRHSVLRMRYGLTYMLVSRKSEAAEQRETDKCGNRRHSQCSAMNSHGHGILLSG